MNARQSTRRFRFYVTLAILTALALGSFWILEVTRRASDELIPTAPRSEPDFFIEQFSYVKISRTSQARYHISGDRLTHNPVDDSYDAINPEIQSTGGKGRAPVTMRSDRAKIENDNSQVHMHGNVRVDRPATADTESLQIRSEYLMILPDEDVIQTDKHVDIRSGQSTLSGVGMYANNATRELRLSSRVHGTYQPPAQ